ncbi:chitooligosaccharidolytic beta-N-acetylglucosaminidase [Malaya genurostris]|uniref:chitooligosaccharidolytic beta-N-acetylglucosaminidase n=1 Tax=Malaya genurostris TaxID=325434 RepID=UPI0026F38BEC|nr:chitooligosaccharidolytic beta-N-acetylglucosaminidase [Malaya genurostris]
MMLLMNSGSNKRQANPLNSVQFYATMRTVTSEASLLLVIIAVLSNCVICTFGASDSLYKFQCIKGKCIRKHRGSLTENEKYFDTINECMLLCDQYGSLWPIPTGPLRLERETKEIVPANIVFDYSNSPNDAEVRSYLNHTQRIFVKTLLEECERNCSHNAPTNVFVSVKVRIGETSLSWTTNESYELHIGTYEDNVEVIVIAQTIFGARHALETLSQLVTPKSYSDGNCLLIISAAHISDAPVYSHRGFLLDTARNFIPMNAIKRQIDGMASVKLNVLHWHVTDSQSFPLELVSLPLVTTYGAYSDKEVYSQQDVREIVSYAKHRGVRVILEFDAPAHAGNGWQWAPSAGLGNLSVCINEQPWRKLCIEPPCGQLNPANPNLYTVLQKVYSEFANLIPPGEILHMGGDEVFFGCWNATQEIVDHLGKNGKGRETKDFLDLWAEFQNNVLQLWDRTRPNEIHSPTVLWSSHLTDPNVIEQYLSNDRYIIQTWVEGNQDLPKQLLQKGYRLIISTKNAWYFDHGFWGITSYYNWKKVYNNRILNNTLVLGGEACVWTEFIDEYSLDSRTWPRLAAVGERLWTNPTIDASKVEGRFNRQRRRLITRGLSPEAVTPNWCEQNEGECQ